MVITFQTIEINNFLSLGEGIKVGLEERGFTLIKGENKESTKSQSNGAGKSSIIDAILWTITGETLRGTTDVVNEKSKSGCHCCLSFSADGESYQIDRYKSSPDKGNACYFYCNGELLSDQTKKSQEMINSKIPVMSSEILGSIVLLGQGLPYKFSSLSPIKRKELLETMSGTSPQIEKIKLQISQESAKNRQSYEKIFREITQKEAEVVASKKLLEQLTESQYQSPEEITKYVDALKKEIGDSQNLCKELEESLQPQRDSYQKLEVARSNVFEFLAKVNAEVSTLQSNLSQVSVGTCPICGRPYDDYYERQLLTAKYSQELAEKQQTVTQLSAKLEGIKSQCNSRDQEVRALENRITALRHDQGVLQERINSYEKSLAESQMVQEKITQTDASIKSTNVEVYDLRKELEKIEQVNETIKYLDRQISRDFKGYVLQEVIKFLSSRAESYGKYLFDGRTVKVELSGNKILIYIDNRLYENLSGGERQRVDLCVQFALRDMLMTTTGFSCNLLVLDEAFDNLDMQGSNDLNQLVISEFSDVSTVFTITHHSDISIPYDNTVRVVKDSSGVSMVYEE